MTSAYDARAAALHRHLDTQIENLERKNYHNRELITDLKKQKLKKKIGRPTKEEQMLRMLYMCNEEKLSKK